MNGFDLIEYIEENDLELDDLYLEVVVGDEVVYIPLSEDNLYVDTYGEDYE